jgi:nitrogen regulatory protein P-II 2
MPTESLKLLTIVAESVLAEQLTTDLKQLGAKGFTLSDVRGEGSRHRRAGELPGENVKVETVVSEAVAKLVMDHLAQNYFSNYSLIVYAVDVAVVRGDKYV